MKAEIEKTESTPHPGPLPDRGGEGSVARVNGAKVAFEMRKRDVELMRLLPTKLVKNAHNLKRYRAILDSIPELGLIEPLMVYPQAGDGEYWLVLDGHLRLLALKQLGWKTAEVIVAHEDERYTYNARVNRLPPIQAHKMIVKAVKNGVKPERIAKALSMPMKTVSALLNLLDDINPDAAELLKDKHMTAEAIRMLRKVTGLRQIEIAEVPSEQRAAPETAERDTVASLVGVVDVLLAFRVVELAGAAADHDVGARLLAEVQLRPVDAQAHRRRRRNVLDVEERQALVVEAVHRTHRRAVAVRELEALIDPRLRVARQP